MSKLSVDEIKEIVENDLPNYKLTKDDEGSVRDLQAASKRNPRMAEVSSLDIASLREKYLGGISDDREAYTEAAMGGSAEQDSEETADDVIVAVSPKTSAQPWDRGSRPKAAVISGSEKKVIGEQG